MQGDQVKALKILSLAKGWNPDRIWDSKTQGYVGESIENFNKPTEIFVNQKGQGTLPQDIPPQQGMFPAATEGALTPPGTMEVPFSTSPQTLNRSRATKGADPFSGMGGTGV